MLYFSKLRVFSVLIFTLIISYFTLSNFTKIDDEYFSKNIKLGLDLQGGSYLLLEIDNEPVIIQRLQSKVLEFKKFFKQKDIKVRNFVIENKSIIFDVEINKIDDVASLLDDDKSEINPYFQQYKSHQFNFESKDSSFTLCRVCDLSADYVCWYLTAIRHTQRAPPRCSGSARLCHHGMWISSRIRA